MYNQSKPLAGFRQTGVRRDKWFEVSYLKHSATWPYNVGSCKQIIIVIYGINILPFDDIELIQCGVSTSMSFVISLTSSSVVTSASSAPSDLHLDRAISVDFALYVGS
jgi:hypothetical protein